MISRLNAAPKDRPIIVSPETFRLLERAVSAWNITHGCYDPTVLDAVIANGYDRTFMHVPSVRSSDANDPSPSAAPGCDGIELNERLLAVTLPAGVRIDPGGIGKGLAADLVAEALTACGADGALVDVGGDIRVSGAGPHDGAWVIDIADPIDESRPLAHLELTDAGIATSSALRRSWVLGDRRHHLIDPATGRPTDTGVAQATVIAPEAWRAEALTKAIFVTGSIDPANGTSAVIVDTRGGRTGTPDLMKLLT